RQAAGDRHWGSGAARGAVVQGDRVGQPGPDADGTAGRGERARARVVTDARTLNRWRRWGYRWLPGESFSYLLHTRPAEWPIMAAHTILGYVLAVGFAGVARGDQLGAALLALALWVVCLNGGAPRAKTGFVCA